MDLIRNYTRFGWVARTPWLYADFDNLEDFSFYYHPYGSNDVQSLNHESLAHVFFTWGHKLVVSYLGKLKPVNSFQEAFEFVEDFFQLEFIQRQSVFFEKYGQFIYSYLSLYLEKLSNACASSVARSFYPLDDVQVFNSFFHVLKANSRVVVLKAYLIPKQTQSTQSPNTIHQHQLNLVRNNYG